MHVAMEIVLPAETHQYNRLINAAETFGFRREARLIQRKASQFSDVFSLFIMGERGVGKSEVVNLLLNRQLAPVNVTQQWTNVYRISPTSREYAHVYTKDQEAPFHLSLHEARALSDGRNLTQISVRPEDVEQIIWFVVAPGLPADVALIEPPGGRPADMKEHYFWQADGIIWVLRADQLIEQEARRTFSELQNKKVLPVMSVGVLTHMDKISRKIWLQVLHQVRKMAGADLDSIVPCSIEQSEVDLIQEDANVILMREVRNRFYARSAFVHKQNQGHFASIMGRALSHRFEGFVDRVLQNRWICKQFSVKVEDYALNLEKDLNQRIEQYISRLKDRAMARAVAVDDAFSPPEKDADSGIPSVQQFWQEIQKQLSRKANDDFSTLRYDTFLETDNAITDKVVPRVQIPGDEVAPVASFRYENPPVDLLEALRGDKQEVSRMIEAPLYAPEGVTVYQPAPVDIWKTAKDWVPEVAGEAEKACQHWIQSTITKYSNSLRQCAELSFRELHGFLPDEAPVVLVPLEKVYEDLRGRQLTVPTPHLPGDGMSPALFLCRMQEAEFVPLWNRQLIFKSFDFVMPRLKRLFLKEIESTRDRLTEQWTAARPSIKKRVELVWKKNGRSLAMKNAVKWSIPWVANLMRDRLLDPVQHLGRRPVQLPDLHPHHVTLFLGRDSSTFQKPLQIAAEESNEPNQVIVEAFQEKLRSKLSHLWRDGKPILVSMRYRKKVRRRTTFALGMMAVFAILWVMMFGTSQMSLFALSVIIVPYFISVLYFLKRMIDQSFYEGSDTQAENVYRQVYKRLNARLDAAKSFVKTESLAEGLREEIEKKLEDKQAPAAALYMPYKVLVNRLEQASPPTEASETPMAS